MLTQKQLHHRRRLLQFPEILVPRRDWIFWRPTSTASFLEGQNWAVKSEALRELENYQSIWIDAKEDSAMNKRLLFGRKTFMQVQLRLAQTNFYYVSCLYEGNHANTSSDSDACTPSMDKNTRTLSRNSGDKMHLFSWRSANRKRSARFRFLDWKHYRQS